jgi:hypothetical protein
MRRHVVFVVACLVLGAAMVAARSPPSVMWLADDLNLPLRDGTALDFAFPYDTRLVDGAEPERDATLTLEICENHGCVTQSLAVVEGTSRLRYGLDPSQYHRGWNLFTLPLTLTDNAIASSDTLTIQAKVTP